jgi:GT2 family glycosyltransferase
MEDPVAVYLASYNTRDYTELCLRSLHRFADRPFALHVGDSGSHDGSREMLVEFEREGWLTLESHADPRRHAVWLDQWLAGADSEYLLFCDSDIQFRRRGFLAAMLDAARREQAAIVSPGLLPTGPYEDERLVTQLMPRPIPWLMLVHTPSLRRLQTSFEEFTEPSLEYPQGKRTFDVGGLLYRRALDAGMNYVALDRRFARTFRHFGGASWQGVAPGLIRRRSPALVLARALADNRRHQPSPSPLAAKP